MQTGIVKWFDTTKGFGFLKPHDGGDDIYVHAKVLQKAKISTIEPGTVVSYSVGQKSGKVFVDEIAVASPPPLDERTDRHVAKNTVISKSADNVEDEFEREWGLRRA